MKTIRIDNVKIVPNPAETKSSILIQVEVIQGILDSEGNQLLDADGACIEFV